MKIMKASAGSGKTYNLAGTYIKLLLESGDPHAYRHILAVTFTNKATAEMKARILRDLSRASRTDNRARTLLVNMLHDYGAFSVSTIDKFFQQTLKAFAREIGQFSQYQIEIDRNSLINESMDRILDNLTEEKTDLVRWIKDSVRDRVEQGLKFNLDDTLYEIGRRLKSEEHRELCEEWGIDDSKSYDKTHLDAIRRSCRQIIGDFEAKATGFGLKHDPGVMMKVPGKRMLKADAALAELFGKPYQIYCTAFEIDSLVFSLGLAGEFYKEFDALLKEKNVMCLDESNTLLRSIIDGSDAPFVYEKTGVRYDHFLLDEFQDTSHIQWENFLPLLHESESRGGRNLIVGDVKQSIYRWRNSDWELLGSKVLEQFPSAEIKVLDSNWRSTREVVGFNNGFFRFAAAAVGAEDIYSDVQQNVMSDDPQPGTVKLSFCEDQLSEVMDSVNSARDAGALWGDIAVLARNKKEGAMVAEHLMAHGVPVISDDSLNLKSSLTVRRLVSLLSCIDNPEDGVNRYLADSLGVVIPASYHSIVDLCEEMLRSLRLYDPAAFDGEAMFIQAFMDDLQSWTGINGNNLRYYLKHWNDSDLYIGSPENSSSVRILTIHKSKGLEFPYVIFPFAEKVTRYKSDIHWCHLDASGTPLGSEVDGAYPVRLGSSSEQTLFADAYARERRMQDIDNLNVFYVALTRASKCLHVIAAEPSKKIREALSKGNPQYMNFSEMLFAYCGQSYRWNTPVMYDFRLMKREEKDDVMDFPASYASIPLAGRLQPSEDALDFFGEDGVTGPAASARLSGIILHGILSEVDVVSDLEAAVHAAVVDGRLDPARETETLELLKSRISSHPEWFPASSESVSVRNEVSIFSPDGMEKRPDRVVESNGKTIVVDYKFGEPKPSYSRQVGSYCKLYRQLGRTDVRGYIWYVPEDRVVEV